MRLHMIGDRDVTFGSAAKHRRPRKAATAKKAAAKK